MIRLGKVIGRKRKEECALDMVENNKQTSLKKEKINQTIYGIDLK